MAKADLESRVRRICLALPEATEKISHGSPAFFVKKQFVMLWVGGHHDHEFPHLWCAAPEGAQEVLVKGDPARISGLRTSATVAGSGCGSTSPSITTSWPD